MAIKFEIHHVNVTVPKSQEAAAKHFYQNLLGLNEVPKPEESRGRGGAWYQFAAMQLHLSVEEAAGDNQRSKRHVCYVVDDLTAAEKHLREAGVEILPDNMPVRGVARFYVHDPGGNRIEIAEKAQQPT